jgi:hypothetical protein
MAIQKEKTLSNGAEGNYWRILSVDIDRQNLRIVGRIGLFKDAATSAAGHPPLGAIKSFAFPFTMVEFAAAPNAIAFIYTKIKTRAAETLDYDLSGAPIDPPRYVDEDLVGGVDVL